jgi:hypothetical protein
MTDITPETRPQNAQKSTERHGRGQNHHFIGCFCIQHDEMEENETKRIFIFPFSVDISGKDFCPDKYPKLMKAFKK